MAPKTQRNPARRSPAKQPAAATTLSLIRTLRMFNLTPKEHRAAIMLSELLTRGIYGSTEPARRFAAFPLTSKHIEQIRFWQGSPDAASEDDVRVLLKRMVAVGLLVPCGKAGDGCIQFKPVAVSDQPALLRRFRRVGRIRGRDYDYRTLTLSQAARMIERG